MNPGPLGLLLDKYDRRLIKSQGNSGKIVWETSGGIRAINRAQYNSIMLLNRQEMIANIHH